MMEMEKRKVVLNRLEIPEDIIFNILKRLPAKTLMRFKCVCKTWLALILDPYFAESHHVQAQSRSDASYLLLYHGDEDNLYAQAIFPTDPEANISPQLPTHSFYRSPVYPCSGIVNGLICLSDSYDKVSVLNLTTGEQRKLPKHKHEPSGYQFDKPSYFLGFDPVTKNYKVLYHHKNRKEKRVECQILTLGSKSWRKIDCPLSSLSVERSVSVNGAIYWKQQGKLRSSISFFDVADEKFLKLLYPEGAASVKQITQVGKNFAMICWDTAASGVVNLWTFEHEDQVWDKQEIFLGGKLISRYDVVGSTRTGEILLTLKQEISRRDSVSRVLLLYNLTTGKCRNVEITRPGQPRMAVDAIITDVAYAAVSNHVENILPLRCIQGKL